MRDLETLRKLVASDWETLQKMSCKPFSPKFLDVAISLHAPQLYSEEELVQVSNLRKQLISIAESRLETNNTERVRRKRCFIWCSKYMFVVHACREIEEMPEEERVMPMNKKSKKITNREYRPSPDLPVEFKNRIIELNGYDIKFLMHKTLFRSDLDPNNSRLSMPINEIMCDFLTGDEIAKLDERKITEGRRRPLIGMEVTVLDPCLREFALLLKKWNMRTNTYNLIKSWNDIVSVNRFEKDQELQIWSFRVQSKLYFLLNKL
ncbi:B3 domain-containing protein, partial [Mucuna pruriens]